MRNALTQSTVLTLRVAIACGVAVGAAAGAEFAFEPIFGPEAPGPYKHPAVIEALENGDLLLAYYGGEGEYAVDTAVYGSRRPAGSETWTPPTVIADTPFLSEGNPVLWQAPDGVVWLFYVCRYGPTWSSSRIKAKLSRDDGTTWSDSFFVTLEQGMMVRNQPIVLADGRYLLPAYFESGEDREFTAADTASVLFAWDADERSWSELGRILSAGGNLQPGVVQASDGRLVAMCRRAGGYGPDDTGYVVRSESDDGGATWSEGVDSEFPNPNAAVEFLKLASGHWMLIYNNSMNDRTPLSVAISTDAGKTYAHRRDLATGPRDYAYPYAVQDAGGTIHLVFTTDGRSVINYAAFTEGDLFPALAESR